ncbi:MAG: acyl carrier protein [Planctomycetota bacterium]|jgi:acyl carrier protein
MTTDTQTIKDQIRGYIIENFLPGEDPSNLLDDTQLKGSGILDSVSTLKLVSFVENRWSLTVEPHEASTDFERIEDIAALVQRKSS